jgi:pyroglutamyl-peptidase
MKVLLSGFEPFGSSGVNPSEKVVQTLAKQGIEGVDLITVILPVERFAGPDTLIRTFISAQPDVVLCLGEAGNRAVLTVEKVGINLLDFLISDNGGNLITDKPIVRDAPDGYFATIPVRPLVAAMNDAHIPTQISFSAGTYLCNQVLYEMLHYVKKNHLPTQVGFVHLPQLPEQVVGIIPARPSMSLDTMLAGIRTLIQTLRDFDPT